MFDTGPPSSLDLSNISIRDGFWTPRITTNRSVTIEYQYDQLETSGCLDNFRRAGAGETGGFEGYWFADTDAYKWIEAASYVVTSTDDPDLERRIAAVIDVIADAQREDGYLNTYFTLEEPDDRWTNLNMMHELYCAGHLFEAAAAHYRATDDSALLDVATRFADHIDATFGDEIDGAPGHQEVELGLVKLARITNEERYVDLARYFVERRGRDDRLAWEIEHPDEIGGSQYDDIDIADHSRDLFCEHGEYDGTYAQDHAPIDEQDTVEGHAVRAMYFFSGAADVARETGDEELLSRLERLWQNMTSKRMYVTGGIGSAHSGERFTEDYDLPNETAYSETCAAIGSIFWNQRLLELTADAKYADLIERILYNGLLVGVSLDGKEFFYDNPLESEGEHTRQGWFDCACCPPNIARLLASLERYLYMKTESDLYVNQYVGNSTETTVNGTDVALDLSSELPWGNSVTIDVAAGAPTAFTFHLRVPEWCDDATIEVDGERVPTDGGGYVAIDRTWDEATVSASFEQSVTTVECHPDVKANANRVALTRGPVVYCLEGVDNSRPLHQFAIESAGNFEVEYDEDLLDGIVTIEGDASVPDTRDWGSELYRPAESTTQVADAFTAVPYYAWDNREQGEMRVWLDKL